MMQTWERAWRCSTPVGHDPAKGFLHVEYCGKPASKTIGEARLPRCYEHWSHERCWVCSELVTDERHAWWRALIGKIAWGLAPGMRTYAAGKSPVLITVNDVPQRVRMYPPSRLRSGWAGKGHRFVAGWPD